MSTFKKTKVVMLTTNEKASSLSVLNSGKLNYGAEAMSSINTKLQHLYFLSDEEIKEGDWCVDKHKVVFKQETDKIFSEFTGSKKIIATTDKSLMWHDKTPIGENVNGLWKILPQPSQSFIEKFVEEYNKGNVITEVMVEYEYSYRKNDDGEDIGFPVHEPLVLKINPKDNTITIRKIKDSWSREEVIELLHKRMEYTFGEDYDKSTTDKWIEENL